MDHTVWDRAAPAYPFCFLIWYAPLIGVCQWALISAASAAYSRLDSGPDGCGRIRGSIHHGAGEVMHWITTVPIGGGWHTEADPAFLLHWSLLALLTWLAIPAAQRLSATRRRGHAGWRYSASGRVWRGSSCSLK